MSEVTKQDLLDLEKRLNEADEKQEARLITAMREMGVEIKANMDAMKVELKANIAESSYSVETKLLRAFHGWARTMEVRVRAGSQSVSSMDERLALAEERISELERRKDSAA